MRISRKASILWFVYAICLPLCLTGCARQASPAATEAEALSFGSYTLLVYMCGGSLETKNGAASADLSEILSADMGENISVVIETGGASLWKKHGISGDKTERYTVSQGSLKLASSAVPENMGEPGTLADFLAWGTKAFPAEKTSLILWGHGTVEGVCADELFGGDMLTPEEIREALLAADAGAMDFIGFDACYSATLDNARAVADYARSMIASQASVPTSGWDYAALAKALGKGDMPSAILQGYAAAEEKASFALSCIELPRIREIEAVFHKLLDSTKESGADILAENSDLLIADTGDMRLYDLGGMAQRYGASTERTGAVRVVSSDDLKAASGISFCVPFGDAEATDRYIAGSTDDVYCGYLKDFLYQTPDEGGIVFSDQGASDGRTLAFAVSEGSLSYVKSAAAEVLLTGEGGEEESLGRMSVSGSNGRYVIPLDGKWASIGGRPLHTDILSEKNGVALLSAPAEVNGRSTRLFLMHNIASQVIVLSGYEAENGTVSPLKSGDALAIKGERLPRGQYTAELSSLPDGRYRYAGQVTGNDGRVFKTNSTVIDIKNGKIKLISVSK